MQILCPGENLPEGVKNLTSGGLKADSCQLVPFSDTRKSDARAADASRAADVPAASMAGRLDIR